MARRAALKAEDILWPVTERTIEAINHNFDLLFRDMGLIDSVVPVTLGGTGLISVDKGDILVADADDSIDTLAAVATGFALISQGVSTVPAWGKIGLTTHVTGVLPIANGGTNASTKTTAFDNLSPLTTKGDIIVHDGANNVRLAVGADDLVLVADSAQAEGIKWATITLTHNLLDSDTHLDTKTASPVRGDVIVSAGLPFNGQNFWFDGSVMPDMDTAADFGVQKFWFDGSVEGGAGLTDSSLLKWRRLAVGSANQSLLTDGVDVFWGSNTPTQPKVKAYRSSNLSIAAGDGGYPTSGFGGNKVAMQAVIFDSDGFWNSGANPERLTVPSGSAGTYLVVGQASWESSSDGRKAAWIYVNGARVGITEVPGDDGSLGLSFTVSTFVRLVAGDYVELVVRQDSTTDPLALLGTSDGSLTQLQMVKVAE